MNDSSSKRCLKEGRNLSARAKLSDSGGLQSTGDVPGWGHSRAKSLASEGQFGSIVRRLYDLRKIWSFQTIGPKKRVWS
jgi:hypothetical protein